MSILGDRIQTRPAELGDTPDAIAATLRDLGVTGARVGGDCPIYHYLSAKIPAVRWVTDDAVFDARPVDSRATRLAVLDEVTHEFIRRFDAGAYPELERAR
jgi:hypothetical protein